VVTVLALDVVCMEASGYSLLGASVNGGLTLAAM
jgi:hypothetical protein